MATTDITTAMSKPMTQKELCLHVGLPKTGTSSIQNFFQKNNESLKQRGLCYPTPLFRTAHHAEGLLVARLNQANRVLEWNEMATTAADQYEGDAETLVSQLNSELEKSSNERKCLILSSEGINDTFNNVNDMSLWRELFHDYKIKLIIYMRRIDKNIEYSILHRTKYKEPLNEDLIKYVSEIKTQEQIQIVDRIEMWGSVVGKENVFLRPFELGQLVNGDAVADIMSIIDSSFVTKKMKKIEENQGLSLECAHFLGEIISYPQVSRTKLEREIADIIVNSKNLRENG